jgi:hypothetical protein
MTIDTKIKHNIFLALTALVAANIRNIIQYDVFATKSVGYFLGTWLIHYFAILIIGALSYGFYCGFRKHFVYDLAEGKPVDTDEFIFIISSITLIASIVAFVGKASGGF